VDEPSASIRDLLARHQENAGATSAIALLFAVVYSAFKRLDWRRSLMAAGAGARFAAAMWIVLAEYLHPSIFMLLPVAAVCGIAAFPLMRAYVENDDEMAQGVFSAMSKFLGRWLKRILGTTP
jgi:hypothetical protein